MNLNMTTKINTVEDFKKQKFTTEEISNSIYYAGIGSRNTPQEVQKIMFGIARNLESCGLILRSGGAQGADLAFEKGVKYVKNKQIFYQTSATPLTQDIACDFHPNPFALRKNISALNLMARNTFQVMGQDLMTPVQFVICYTEDGCKYIPNKSQRKKETGGTGQAIAIASYFNIPVYNLKNEEDLESVKNLIEKLK